MRKSSRLPENIFCLIVAPLSKVCTLAFPSSAFRLQIKRPLCLLCLIYISFLVLFQTFSSPRLPDLTKADGHFLTLSGQIMSRETTASGYTIILSHVTFPEKNGQGSRTYNRLSKSLSEMWPAKGRVLVYLNGPGGVSASSPSYGEGGDGQLWAFREKMTDQSSVYEKAKIGRRITLYGKVSIPEPARNPGQFDAGRYYRSRSVYMKMSQVRLRDIRREETSGLTFQSLAFSYLNALADLRLLLRQASLKVFGETYCPLIDAIVLGDRSGLDDDVKSLFEDGGIMHILAVSSLHVTLLGMTLYKLLRKMRKSFLFASVFSGGLVISYCLMTGNSFSAVRAAVMFLFWLGSQIFGRTADRLTSLAAAALFILIRHPYAISDTGFLLSFSCILSIELLSPVFRKIYRPGHELLVSLIGSISLQAGILPLSALFFYQITPFGVLLNLIVIPAMSLFMTFGVLGCLAGLFALLPGAGAMSGPSAGLLLTGAKLISGPCGYLLDLFCALCKAARMLPGDIIITGRPSLWKIIVYYLVLCLFCVYVERLDKHSLRRKRKVLPLAFSALLAALTLLVTVPRTPHFRYTCLDIGQGSCNLIEKDGFNVLFDAGSSSVTDVYPYRIESTLKYYGISKIDLVFLSHGDIDHINGIGQMLESYHTAIGRDHSGGISIGRILVPDLRSVPEEYSGLDDILSLAREAGIPVSLLSQGMRLTQEHGDGKKASASRMSLEILSPSKDRMMGEANQDCIVMLLRYKNLQILFPGDLEKEGEEKFTAFCRENETFSSSDDVLNILIAGHHGSKNATSGELLKTYQPDLVLISCGKNNRYGHPAPSMLKRLKRRHIPFIRTDACGFIRITERGSPGVFACDHSSV